ncbi:MAG: AMP-binding protein [Gammaproteobacteria bacterium]|nr:AMP-binding protein [Gammaproteobacteria bacterium]
MSSNQSVSGTILNQIQYSFFHRLQHAATRAKGRTALHLEDGSSVSYASLYTRAGQYAVALRAAGLSKGDRVVVQVEKSPQTLALYLGTLQCGAIYVPLNTAYTREEVAYFLGDAEPQIFVHGGFAMALESRFPQVAFRTLDAAGKGSMADAADQSVSSTEIGDAHGADLAAIVYTSGTTGRSKGAMLSHHNLSSNADSLIKAWGWRNTDVLLHALPIFHVHGLFIALHCALLTGTPMIWLPKFVAAQTLAALKDATVLMGVPTFYTRLLAEPGLNRRCVKHMRVFISGSAPLTPQTFAEFEQRTGHRILERYGMSETIINTTNPLEGERLPGTVGYPLPGVEARIADQSGVELPRGEVGMIEVRGPNVFSGYWRMPDKTREEIRVDGWFITGDLGVMAADGHVSIVGRGKDLVISGGYNVYPIEIEEVLDTLPGVRESAVIGVPHPDFGEAVVAVVVPSETELQLDFVLSGLANRLARFKQPKAIFNVPELPRNTMGKVQKNVLRERYARTFSN